MIHHLARFLNNTHSTLRFFSFETSLIIDFSPFFSALGFFPHLYRLALSIPTSHRHLGDPSALKGFLHLHHDTLEHLSFRGFCTNNVQSGSVRVQHARSGFDSSWLSECLSGTVFSSLHTLNVGTSFISLDVVMLCIEQWADTLTELDITGEYLNYEQVEDILDAFVDRRLRSLSISVTALCPELVDMLAAYVPELTKLHLRIRSVAPHRYELPPTYVGRGVKQNELPRADRFCAEMGTRNYEGWKLEDIGIWRFTSKLQYQARYVDALRDSIRRK
ncbi:hypothetical protein B0H11DRAFT_957126 [Mycena galericulata]|nr:hypothetical protein B0H11DRAFT_957126 [Mycena galericulata]